MTDNKEEIDLTSPVKEIVNDTSAIDSKSQAQLRITEPLRDLRGRQALCTECGRFFRDWADAIFPMD